MDAHQKINFIGDKSSALPNKDKADDMLPIEMTNITGTHLLDLNEYCLVDIFSNHSLTPIDLCSLTETCKRINEISQSVFPKEFGLISGEANDVRYNFQRKKYSVFYCDQHVERILKNFGPRLVVLKLDVKNQDVVDLITKYCGDVTLKRLEIVKMCSIESFRLKLKSIFQRLLALTLEGCDLLATSPDFNCDSLVELKIFASTGCSAILNNNFPNLKRFAFRCDLSLENYDNTGAISEFIGRHGRLSALYFVGSSMQCSSEFVHGIDDSCKELEELTLRFLRRPNISFDGFSLLSLPKLKKLNVCINFENYNQIVALLQASSSLETVVLFFDDEVPLHLFDILSQQQHLRELRLFRFPFDRIPWTILTQIRKLWLFELQVGKFRIGDLINIIKQLTNLEELRFNSLFRNGFVLNEKDLIQIVRTVDQRPNVLTLRCRCDFNVPNKGDKNHKVRLIKIT